MTTETAKKASDLLYEIDRLEKKITKIDSILEEKQSEQSIHLELLYGKKGYDEKFDIQEILPVIIYVRKIVNDKLQKCKFDLFFL